MGIAEIRSIYGNDYADSYNDLYLLGENFRECTEYEISEIGCLLEPKSKWLDVACGTGYMLSRFPEVERAGLDISPSMLSLARLANPDSVFVEGDFRVGVPKWNGQWNLVSLTWYAYCYAETMSGVERVLSNLVAWTSKNGACFLPVCDPDVLCKTAIPRQPPSDSTDGQLLISALIWEWIDEPSKKRHKDMIAPHIDWMLSFFERHFHQVHLLTYPGFKADCMFARKAIIAREKRVGEIGPGSD